jgi:glycosyltransferase involved in cell wall biosynthesis
MIETNSSQPRLKIAIVVHGRFHAFDLARELIRQGVQVTLLTNYPKYIAAEYGIPKSNLVNCVWHGVAYRLAERLAGRQAEFLFESLLHRSFSKWAARKLSSLDVDVVHAFSGVSEELLLSLSERPVVKSLVRGSAHIRTQARLLEEESNRCGQEMEHPSDWRIAREEREYELADMIFVLSSFARRSFETEGVSMEKVRSVSLGSELKRFRASEDDIERRCRRIVAGEPLQVLTVGSFSFRKGALDLSEIAAQLSGRMKFRMVGDVPSNAARLKCTSNIEFIPRQPQLSLSSFYRDADVFLFPTIEDGYAVVLSQAQAAGLPILATPNCAAPDILRNNDNGWILPIRNPAAFIAKLEWCDSNRQRLADMVRCSYEKYERRDWAQVATDLITTYQDWLSQNELELVKKHRTWKKPRFSSW